MSRHHLADSFPLWPRWYVWRLHYKSHKQGFQISVQVDDRCSIFVAIELDYSMATVARVHSSTAAVFIRRARFAGAINSYVVGLYATIAPPDVPTPCRAAIALCRAIRQRIAYPMPLRRLFKMRPKPTNPKTRGAKSCRRDVAKRVAISDRGNLSGPGLTGLTFPGHACLALVSRHRIMSYIMYLHMRRQFDR